MRFCSECGTSLSEAAEFCPNCGKQVEQEAAAQKETIKTEPAQSRKQSKQDFGAFFKKHKKLLSIGLSIAVVLIAGYLTLSHFNSPERYVSGIMDAIEEDDYEALVGKLFFADTDEEISEDQIVIYVSYLKENRNRIDQIKTDFEAQIEMFDDQSRSGARYGEDPEWRYLGDEMFLVKEDGFLTDSYRVFVEPSYATVESYLEGLTLNDSAGELLHTFTERETSFNVGPLVRGEHVFHFAFEGEWMDLEEEYTYYVSDYQSYFNPEFNVDYLTFEAPFEHDLKDRLVVNGTEIEDPTMNEEMGPFLLEENSTYSYEVDFPWGTMTTGERPIDSRHIYLNFDMTEEMADQLAAALQNHYDSVLDSFEQRDVSLLSDQLSQNIQDVYKNEIENLYWNLEYYDGRTVGLHYRDYQLSNQLNDFGKSENGNWFMKVVTLQEKNMLRTTETPTDSELDDYRQSKRLYTFNYVDDAWVVTDYSGAIFGTVEDPFVYTYEGDFRLIDESGLKEESGSDEEEESDEDVEAAITSQVEGYVNHLVDAINAGDYSIVEPYIASGSSLESDQQGLVDRLSEAGTTQEVDSVEVVSVDADGDAWKVDVEETITINYESGESETNDYSWTYTVVEEDGAYVLSEIE